VAAQEIGGGGKRVGLGAQIELAVAIAVAAEFQDIAGQELGLSDLAVFRADGR
jgi:hypothetical protein